MQIDFLEDDKPRFTPEWLRKYPGLEHLTDEEALKRIATLEMLVEIFFESEDLIRI